MSNSTCEDAVPVYFEMSWAIESSMNLLNLCLGVMVLGITSYSPIWLVPMVVSATGAVANGLCYYAFYEHNPVINTAVASAFADITWGIQEAGASFYSYMILTRVLQGVPRLVFKSIFWTLMTIIACIRVVILVTRVRFILSTAVEGAIGDQATSVGDVNLQNMVDHLHVGYFTSIALVELTSAFFLLREFRSARAASRRAAVKTPLFNYLMRSTEIRVSLLAVVGVMRAITYSFQTAAQSANNVPSELDRFAATLENYFPLVMFVDMLASRLVFSGGGGVLAGPRFQSGRISEFVRRGPADANGGPNDRGFDPYFFSTEKETGEQGMGGGGSSNGEIITKQSSDNASGQEFIIDGAGHPVLHGASDSGHIVTVGSGEPRRAEHGPASGHDRSVGVISQMIEFEACQRRCGLPSPV